jgi:rubrerythrin
MSLDDQPMDSLPELVAFALVTEQRARDRYQADAANMRSLGNASLANVFQRLAQEETRHVAELEGFANQSGLMLDMQKAAARFDAVSRSEAKDRRDDNAAHGPLTPYAVLARAVRHEERAFQFYCQVAATSSNPEMRAYAEAFAHEELAHAALFRAERRNAFQAERRGRQREPLDPTSLKSEQDMVRLALQLEREFADQLGDGPAELISACTDLIAELEEAMTDSAPATNPVSHGDAETASLHERLDHLFWVYDRIASMNKVEAVANLAQSLTAKTLDRMMLLSPDMPRDQV